MSWIDCKIRHMDVLKSAMGRLVCAENVTCLLAAHIAKLWMVFEVFIDC